MRLERPNLLLVDTGDLLYSPSSVHDPNALRFGELKGDLYMKTYNLMGYDAFTPGELDLSFGVDRLLQLSQRAQFPLLAANLMDSRSRKPVFQPYRIKEVRGIKIGLIGLISNQYALEIPPEEKGKYSLEDPVETATELVAKLKKTCQVIVVLGHMGPGLQTNLAQAVPGIHFILSGHISDYERDPVRIKETQIFNAGSRGEYLGRVDFIMRNKKSQVQYQLVALTTDYADHPKVMERIDQYKSNLRSYLQSLPQAGRQMGSAFVGPDGSTTQLLFMGESYCLPCHQAQHQSWLQTAHARAYQTLIRGNKSSDPACLTCHTTGFASLKNSGANLVNVQCEACHGPGEGHPDTRKSLLKISQDQCFQCHNRANSPNFHYPGYLDKIRHARP